MVGGISFVLAAAQMAALVRACEVVLYSDCFSGHTVQMQEGVHGLHDHPWYIGDSVSSIKVHGFGCMAELHPDSLEDGQPWYFPEGAYPCETFSHMAGQDSASVIRVYRRHNLEPCGITLYSECFGGHEVTIGEGYHNLHEHPWYIGDQVSSVRVHGFGCVAELHPDSFEDGQSWYIPQGDYDCDKFGAMAAHDSASVLLVYRAQP